MEVWAGELGGCPALGSVCTGGDKGRRESPGLRLACRRGTDGSEPKVGRVGRALLLLSLCSGARQRSTARCSGGCRRPGTSLAPGTLSPRASPTLGPTSPRSSLSPASLTPASRRAALGHGAAALSLGLASAALRLPEEPQCPEVALAQLPAAEARSQLQALVFGMAGRIESLEKRLEGP